MYELIQVAERTYYMDCPSKVGFYRISDAEVVLIDSGSDKDAGKKVKKILDSQGWTLKAIYNTHSHADHIGGNQYLQGQTGCRIFAPGIENCFVEYPILEPTMLYGGYSMQELRNKFLMAKESHAEKLTDDCLPDGLSMLQLPGHSYDMVGFRTSDNVVFLADCLSGVETLEKYQIGFLYDVQAYLDTLEMVKTLRADCFIPSHAEATDNVAELAQINIEKTIFIADTIRKMLSHPKSFEDILAEVFAVFGLNMTLQQNALIGSTVKSYLSYLKNKGLTGYSFADNRMLWQCI